ncbi:S-adenosyl-L-methionine-dependent methyltransferase [Pleurostoma richardsiae]|uniref:S-adenosyl-L-methionine-dependent methyltransferase n=1 Tax=Pleurostoma richardsiae TaxID=41990 RepID=A0AA38RPC4_9PEZI|nr:S-adenosyl-L-methionine-dependent methyltransferase [Pleurostoma richardsiae]
MASKTEDHWSSEAYQHAASFVPKLATKVMQWLDPQKDDVILDIGCGDGVLDLEIAKVLGQGKGRLHGQDSSPSMIEAAKEAHKKIGVDFCTFEVFDALDLIAKPELQKQEFTKAFSNAAMHWILRPPEKREGFFKGVREALAPGGTFVFETGGLGNVSEMVAGLLSGVGRRIGVDKAKEINPWFFMDEDWVTHMLEQQLGGWKVEKIEREWRPTTADAGGVNGWVRLMGKKWFEAVPESEREQCIKEVVDVLEVVCAKPGGGYMFSYVRLRVKARKL